MIAGPMGQRDGFGAAPPSFDTANTRRGGGSVFTLGTDGEFAEQCMEDVVAGAAAGLLADVDDAGPACAVV